MEKILTAEQRIKMTLGDQLYNLLLASATVEELRAEIKELKGEKKPEAGS